MDWRKRLVSVLAVAYCAACSPADGGAGTETEAGESIACAIGAGSELNRTCRVEEIAEAAARFLVVRHPDGGFRRFQLVDEAEGLTVADGADHAAIVRQGDMIAISVGADRYLFPARVRANASGE